MNRNTFALMGGLMSFVFAGCEVATDDAPPVAAPRADVIFQGTVLTLIDDTSEAEALAIRDDAILAVGPRAEVDRHRGPATRIVDLGEGALLPGFIDAHGHLTQLAAFADFANIASPPVGPARNIEELQEILREHARENPDHPWIVGRGYDESLLAEGRHPTREDLDAVSSDRPVFILHVSLHLMAANSRALELAGIDASTPDPKAGVIRRRPGSREPNGVLEEHAGYLVYGAMPQPSAASMMKGLAAAQAEYARNGFTTLQDGATSADNWALLEGADRAGALQQDVVAFAIWNQIEKILPGGDLASNREHLDSLGRLSLGGVKLVLDGSPQGKTAYLTKPYVVPPDGQGPDYRGYPAHEDAELEGEMQRLSDMGFQLMVHANGDAAVDQMIGALDRVNAKTPMIDRRSILIHGQATRKDQLGDLARLGVVPSLFSAHTFFWGDWHRDSVFGPERAAGISPTRSALEQGLPLTIHMDAPVLPPDSMRMIWATVNRRTRSGAELGPDERIPVMAAIAATTRTAAYQHFMEAEKGTLEPGKLADLVWVEKDPRRVDPLTLADLEVLGTWSRGRLIHVHETASAALASDESQ